jgi:hypothetical protein
MIMVSFDVYEKEGDAIRFMCQNLQITIHKL